MGGAVSTEQSGVTNDAMPLSTQQFPQICPWYLKVHRNWAIGHTEVQGLDVLPLPDVHPGVVGHRREASRDLGIGSQGDVLQGIQLLKLLGGNSAQRHQVVILPAKAQSWDSPSLSIAFSPSRGCVYMVAH